MIVNKTYKGIYKNGAIEILDKHDMVEGQEVLVIVPKNNTNFNKTKVLEYLKFCEEEKTDEQGRIN